MRLFWILVVGALVAGACSSTSSGATLHPDGSGVTSAPARIATSDLRTQQLAGGAALAREVASTTQRVIPLGWAGVNAAADGLRGRLVLRQPEGGTRLGFTLTHDAGAIVAATTERPAVADALASTVDVSNQHIMGFGALNINPAPGVYDWASLDQRIDAMRALGTTPVVTLCCAPDWMKGGEPGQTDWSQFEVAPLREHYKDFADLAVAVAQRYPDVRHFIVWNELKGFYDPDRNDWDLDAYLDLYNQVFTALKAHDPTLLVGGPYVAVASWAAAETMSHPSVLVGDWGVADQRALDAIDYWLANAAGADFIVVDGGSATQDAGWITTPGASAAKFAAVATWISDRTHLPIWWAELHGLGALAANGEPSQQLGPDAQAAVLAASLVQATLGGVDVVLLWPATPGGSQCHGCLWTGAGEALSLSPWAGALQRLHWSLPQLDLDAAIVDDLGVVMVPGPELVLVVNPTDRAVTVAGPDGPITRGPWSVEVVLRAP